MFSLPMTPTSFKHKSAVYIRFSDLDALGHVNNAIYLTYMEQARVLYFDEVIRPKIDWNKAGFILANAHVDYIKPILMNDKITILARVNRFGNKSFDMEYLFMRAVGDSFEPVAKGLTVLVAFDYETQESIGIPEAWKQTMLAFEE
jgi:acyl-CoA thioester hydrolase